MIRRLAEMLGLRPVEVDERTRQANAIRRLSDDDVELQRQSRLALRRVAHIIGQENLTAYRRGRLMR